MPLTKLPYHRGWRCREAFYDMPKLVPASGRVVPTLVTEVVPFGSVAPTVVTKVVPIVPTVALVPPSGKVAEVVPFGSVVTMLKSKPYSTWEREVP